MLSAGVLSAAACLVAVCGVVSTLFNSIQPFPYMDEEFHIPQVQRFCAHNFSYWDPMITTLPGLYLSSLVWVEPVSWLANHPALTLCIPSALRLQNAVFTVVNFFVLHWLVKHLHSFTTPNLLILSATNLSVFPLLFFFSFLYYTDVGTTLFTLMGYGFALSGRHLPAAISLLLAVCFRQTAIVWVMFVAGAVALKAVEPNLSPINNMSSRWAHLMSAVQTTISSLPTLFSILWPYMAVVLLFLVFLAVNGSIVVGDKAHHIATLHFTQLCYFVSFSAVFASGQLVMNWPVASGYLQSLRKPLPLITLVLMMLCGLGAVHYFTCTHPYLLADNRHYPFYIWKDIFQRHEAVKYVLVPLYSAAAMLLAHSLALTQTYLWLLLFFICCVVSLVPQCLLEFRYFILPYLFLRLHMPQGTALALMTELIIYGAVNFLTIALFLYRPFYWPDSSREQRFMW